MIKINFFGACFIGIGAVTERNIAMPHMDVVKKFLKYVSFCTQSDEYSGSCPSSNGQSVLAEELAKQLKALGLNDAHADRFGYVYAHLDGDGEPLGLIAHMDTSPDAPGENIKPEIVEYSGGDIQLSCGEIISEKVFPFLSEYKGKHLIVTDGTTLLGADDKAGVAEIVAAVEYLASHPEVKHRPVSVCFTPDEEIGCGTDHFDKEKFAAGFAYTVDGGRLGEIEYENFNAASAVITVRGVNIHPGSAKNKMLNAALLAVEFVSRMPDSETPRHTDGYEGFYHVSDISANETAATVRMIIRDHDREKFEARKTFVRNLIAYENSVWGEDVFSLEMSDSYYNMRDIILPHYELIENAVSVMKSLDIEPRCVPIRGGTDGARLSYMGIPCPNLCTGGENFHGVHEFVCTEDMEKMVDALIKLSQL